MELINSRTQRMTDRDGEKNNRKTVNVKKEKNKVKKTYLTKFSKVEGHVPPQAPTGQYGFHCPQSVA